MSVVTDFEEFSVFDCRIKPNPNDKSSVGRIAYYTFDEYLDKFDAIYDVFSKDAVLKGSFDRYAESTKGKKGTAEVDSEFLKEIESWRELLAKNIALRNPDVSIYELNYAVQKIIDRIIFLRICEDRAIEPYGQLQTKAESGDVYTHLLNHFKLAESKYDSGIFDFDTDRITQGLRIDDRVLKTIIQSLYYPKSPYEFSVLGVEILGNVYEQFLGKVIRLTAGHQAKVETKPEVKKAGGVYYTPQYIVDYIVKNTVGKLVEGKGKTPEEIVEIKVLDPACGSGSFLIGAYTYLLQYHLDWYVSNEPKKHKEAVFQVRENEWYLTTAEKKRILLNNIFGVDIDPQAVEVTKLSLLLKVLEHESRESIDQQVKLGLEGVLPNLEDNIKCGNSLIGPDFYDTGQQETLFDEAEMRRVNVFDWDDDRKGFGKIMKCGRFDCVIGNPPYIRLHNIDKKALKYFFGNYQTAEKKCDIYAFFTERVLKTLLRKKGVLGYIISNTWLNLDSFTKLRQIVTEENRLIRIVTLNNPFYKVSVTPIMFFVEKDYLKEYKFCVSHLDLTTQDTIDEKEISSQTISPPAYIIDLTTTEESVRVVDKIGQQSIPLGKGNIAKIQYGIMTADNKKFVVTEPKTKYHKLLLAGEDIRRYHIKWPGNRYVDYRPEEMKKKKTARPGEPERFEQEQKIVFQRYSSTKLIAALDTYQFYTLGTTIIGYSVSQYSNKYLLGLINSRLLSWWYGRAFTSPTNYIREFEILPIRTIDFSNPEEVAKHDKLVSIVESMLELQEKYHEAKMERDKELYERQIKLVDAQIDRLVYELYGLTEEEVKVAEGHSK
ncbi:MAG TPA: hypothetical protein C5S37_04230 [Methanophagales archaeon]|nr:hypothetical protein [Methanophagales archaeon]